MKKIASSTVGDTLNFVLPPGEYFIGDPCFLLTEEQWQEIIGLKWWSEFPDDSPEKDSDVDHNVVLETDKGLMIIWPTQVGDGNFVSGCSLPTHEFPPLNMFGIKIPNGLENHKLGSFLVVSGNLSIISKAIVPDVPTDKCVGSFTLSEEKVFWIDDYSNLANEDESLDILVCEPPDEEEEEEEEEDE